MAASKDTLAESLKKIEAIAQWFDDQEEIDVEKGLAKVKEGAALIKESKKKLKEVQNDFAEVKKSLDA